ncbi:hypothetical protein HY439_00790 [Candidatus Microgenomates bacterium]|nr:hypothetical protein [Candidatus Microgenomates bacterium]
MDPINTLVFTSFVANLLLALFIHFRLQKNTANWFFEIATCAVAFWCASMLFYRLAGSDSTELGARVLYFSASFTAPSFLLFGIYFVQKKVNKRLVVGILVSTFLAAILSLYPGAVIEGIKSSPNQEKIIAFGWAYPFYVLHIAGLFGAFYAVFFYKYFQHDIDPLLRTQIQYVLGGTFLISLLAMFTNLTLPTFGYFGLNWVGQVLTTIWFGFITYAIIRHRWLDIHLVAARAVAYTLLLLIFAIFYTAAFFTISVRSSLVTYNSAQLIIAALFALILVFSFQPLLGVFEKFTDNIFYRGHYNSAELLNRLGRIMNSTLNLSELADRLLSELLSQMKVSRSYFSLIQDSTITWIKTADTGQKQDFDPMKINKLINASVDAHNDENLLIFEEMPESESKQTMRENNFSVVLPLIIEQKPIGAILLGEKSSGDIYSKEDINVLKIFASDAAVAVRNALSYGEIKRFNITLEKEVSQATASLKVANERLKQLDRLKSEFVSVASHELRTPMTIIKSYLWLLLEGKDGSLTEKQKLHLDRAYSSTDRLIALVNDLLNVSRIESGRLNIEMKPVDLKTIFSEVISEMLPRLQEQKLEIQQESLSENIPLVSADPEKIKEVLFNLIGNSLKFTPEGGKITISLSHKDNEVAVSVTDTGKGISQEDMPKLFQKFGRVGTDNYLVKSENQGTGLGLYISKSLIEHQGGKMWAYSDGENKGATFSFSLKNAN